MNEKLKMMNKLRMVEFWNNQNSKIQNLSKI